MEFKLLLRKKGCQEMSFELIHNCKLEQKVENNYKPCMQFAWLCRLTRGPCSFALPETCATMSEIELQATPRDE